MEVQILSILRDVLRVVRSQRMRSIAKSEQSGVKILSALTGKVTSGVAPGKVLAH